MLCELIAVAFHKLFSARSLPCWHLAFPRLFSLLFFSILPSIYSGRVMSESCLLMRHERHAYIATADFDLQHDIWPVKLGYVQVAYF